MARPPQGGLSGGALAQLEGRHRSAGGNALRAAVLGANDGLVSNLSLVMGVAGAEFSGRTILVTGLAGLIAGACSMAMGEWLSVNSSREFYQDQIAGEAAELDEFPEEEQQELALIYQAKGLPEPQAKALAERLIGNRTTALDTLAREELGINPEELGGSAWAAGATSFLLFSGGAIIPVLPFFALDGLAAIGASLGLAAAAMFAIGAGTTLFTGRGVIFSGLQAAGDRHRRGRRDLWRRQAHRRLARRLISGRNCARPWWRSSASGSNHRTGRAARNRGSPPRWRRGWRRASGGRAS